MYLDKPKDLQPGDLFVGQHASGLAMVDRPLSGNALKERLVAYLKKIPVTQKHDLTADDVLHIVLASVYEQVMFEVDRTLRPPSS